MNPEFNEIFSFWTAAIGVDLVKLFFGLFVVGILILIFIDQFY